MTTPDHSLKDLLRIMERLRDPDYGCPWDLRQDFKSLLPSTLEECYELAQAIESGDSAHIAEELGDVLFQVVFYAQLGAEQGTFSFEQVVSVLAEKLLRRHPHVFSDGDIEGLVSQSPSVEQVKESWEAIKQRERKAKSQSGALDDIPLALPALPRAQKVQKRAAAVGFDWPDLAGAREKLLEELAELDEATEAGLTSAIEDELGDVLFSCVNVSRHLGLDAEAALRRATAKFERRFTSMIDLAAASGDVWEDLENAQREALWAQVKLEPEVRSKS